MVLARLALQNLTLLKLLVIDINWNTIVELMWANIIMMAVVTEGVLWKTRKFNSFQCRKFMQIRLASISKERKPYQIVKSENSETL